MLCNGLRVGRFMLFQYYEGLCSVISITRGLGLSNFHKKALHVIFEWPPQTQSWSHNNMDLKLTP